MDANFSEGTFKTYLHSYRFEFQENYIVGSQEHPRDVDFFITSPKGRVYADVKEVRDSREDGYAIKAHLHIRDDIEDIRCKFKENRPDLPLLLVSMNLSTTFFTGLTVVQAMMGDIGVEFNPYTNSITKPLHHLHKGDAALTQKKHKTISGIFVFDLSNHRHVLFTNLYADNPIEMNYFPDVKELQVSKDANHEELKELSNIMFWNTNFK